MKNIHIICRNNKIDVIMHLMLSISNKNNDTEQKEIKSIVSIKQSGKQSRNKISKCKYCDGSGKNNVSKKTTTERQSRCHICNGIGWKIRTYE